MKKRLLSITSFILVACMLFTAFPVAAASVDNYANGSESYIGENMTIKSTNSVGSMIADAVGEEHDKQEENNGVNIFSIEVEGNIATAQIETVLDATLIVGIYSEDGIEMYASGKTDVLKDDESAQVTIDIETMPQYFYLKAYIVDSNNYKPLCTVYESPNYTQEMQEFFAKSSNDFEQDRVLNFDENLDNNFAVYNDDVTLIEKTEGTNIIASADDNNKVYVIENADQSILSLVEGQIFSYEYEEGNVIIIKVKSISINGTTATIEGEEIELNDVFDYVKIDGTSDLSGAEYDTTGMDEDVSIVENEEESNNTKSGDAVGAETSGEQSATMKFNFRKEDPEKETKVNGNLEISFKNTAKVYLTLSYQYVELSLEYKVKLSFSLKLKEEIKIPIVKFAVSPCIGVFIEFTPSIVLECKGTLELSGTLKGSIGFRASLQNGIENISKEPRFEAEVKLEITIFVGISLEPKVSILCDTISAKLTAKVGAEIKASIKKEIFSEEPDTKTIHECNNCVEGTIHAKLSLSFEIKFLNNDHMKLKFDLLELKIKIADFYFSFDYGEFAFTTCPHKKYLLTVSVIDSSNQPVSGATVYGQYTSNSSGISTFYLPNGSYDITAESSGQSASKSVNVENKATSVVINLGGASSGSGSGSGSGSSFSNSDVVQIDAGNGHSAAITKDGDLYLWGRNDCGQLGNGSYSNKNTPTKISVGTNQKVKKVSLGAIHSAAITTNNTLYAWGCGGRLGNGSYSGSATPVKIMDNVEDVSFGIYHSAAVTLDGKLYTWGDDYNGSTGVLGNGSYSSSSTPIYIMNNVKSVSSGELNTAAITKNGDLYVWGNNQWGQIGDGTTQNSNRPVKVMSNVRDVSVGSGHIAAITVTVK